MCKIKGVILIGFPEFHYPHHDDHYPLSLELESERTGGNPYRSLDV